MGAMILLLIALGGAVGSVARYLLASTIQGAIPTPPSPGFPYGTLAVNIIGCILIGLLWHAFLGDPRHTQLHALFITGFCGGFTTFSAFSVETVGLIQGGEWASAGIYVFLSVAAGIGGTMIAFTKTVPK
jgi:CrcB protein